jgi:hypothetical protein
MHFASAAEIEPGVVIAATFAAFRAHLDASLLKEPDRTYCATIDGWRAARATVVGWPDVEVVRPNRHKVWALPLEQFTESFRFDLDAWLDRLSNNDLLSDGPLRPVRPITRRSHAAQIRRFASAVASIIYFPNGLTKFVNAKPGLSPVSPIINIPGLCGLAVIPKTPSARALRVRLPGG